MAKKLSAGKGKTGQAAEPNGGAAEGVEAGAAAEKTKPGRRKSPSPYDNYDPKQLQAEQKLILEMGCGMYDELQRVLQQASEVRGKIGKNKERFEKAGGDKGDYDFYIKTRLRDPEEVDRETARRNKLLLFMGFPVGTQLGMFDDGESVATKSENATKGIVSPDDLAFAREEGIGAGLKGEPKDSCPYDEGSPQEIHWSDGWANGLEQRATASRMAEGQGATA